MPTNYSSYVDNRAKFWDAVWSKKQNKYGWGKYYHRRLLHVYGFIIPENSRVLEIGCGNGKLIGQLKSNTRVGIDFSMAAIELAGNQYPKCHFECTSLMDFKSDETFDYIIMSDLVGDLWDVELALVRLRSFCHEKTRIIINYYSKLWEIPLKTGQKFGLKKPNQIQNWLSPRDVANLLYLSDYEVVKEWQEVLLPLGIPVLRGLCNHFLVKLWFFRFFALTNFTMARLKPDEKRATRRPSVSVVVAARNEAGHIKELVSRLPVMGSSTELIFVEGGSGDNTYDTIKEVSSGNHPFEVSLYRQSGKGKGDAVRKGFNEAKGDILMILDADITVPPEKLPQFYSAITGGKGDFINGVRLVYPMEKGAMRSFNLVGNKFFSMAFSWLLGQSIKDTLCGTKVLWRSDYHQIRNNRSYFGEFDPFGDFDLLFGASKLGLKIQDLPIRYQERMYGETNIQRWKHGWLLLRMVAFAARKIKFI